MDRRSYGRLRTERLFASSWPPVRPYVGACARARRALGRIGDCHSKPLHRPAPGLCARRLGAPRHDDRLVLRHISLQRPRSALRSGRIEARGDDVHVRALSRPAGRCTDDERFGHICAQSPSACARAPRWRPRHWGARSQGRVLDRTHEAWRACLLALQGSQAQDESRGPASRRPPRARDRRSPRPRPGQGSDPTDAGARRASGNDLLGRRQCDARRRRDLRLCRRWRTGLSGRPLSRRRGRRVDARLRTGAERSRRRRSRLSPASVAMRERLEGVSRPLPAAAV